MLDAREFTLETLARQADLYVDGFDGMAIELAMQVESEEYVSPDRSVGECGGWFVTCHCVGARLSFEGEVALTREQAIELLGAVAISKAENDAAEGRSSLLDED